MKVLITGATGFLGKAIAEEFHAFGFEVFTASKSSKQLVNINLDKHFQIDTTDRQSFERLKNLTGIDIIIHAAGLAHQFGRTPEILFHKVNVQGAGNIAALAAEMQIANLLLISSVAVYGDVHLQPERSFAVDEKTVCNPCGAYAASKYEAEKTVREMCGRNNMKLTILRPATVIGENDRGNVARLIKIIDKNKFVWIGTGENRKSLIYKRDVAAACRLAAESSRGDFSERIYNVAAEPLKMREIVAEISAGLGKTILKPALPEKLIKQFLSAAAGLTNIKRLRNLSDTVAKWTSDEDFSGEKIKSELGFDPRFTIREGIRKEVEYYKSAQKKLS